MNSLVSVVIATYNSSQFLTETLDSVSKQTWNNIELIITDDASSDNTTEVYNKWIINNGKRFIYSEIITAQKNTGVSANVNRGLHASKGEWIVLLAGDDTLKAKCIEDNMLFINTHPEVKVLFSRIDVYRDTFDPVNHIKTIPDDPFNVDSIMAPGRSADSQYKMLLISDRITFTPSVYFHRETLLSVGGFDERFKLLEDYPIWLKLTKKGIRLNFMDKVTVNYRQHSKAINNTGHSPGVMIPGQLGPIRREAVCPRWFLTRSISMTGIPSVMQTISSIPASTASRMASAAKEGGTRIIEALAPVSRRAALTVSKTGTSSINCPPLPGVTPATTFVPYSMHCLA